MRLSGAEGRRRAGQGAGAGPQRQQEGWKLVGCANGLCVLILRLLLSFEQLSWRESTQNLAKKGPEVSLVLFWLVFFLIMARYAPSLRDGSQPGGM